jgi:TetR/AcrR family transcriptional regulator, copper-responsive repressor
MVQKKPKPPDKPSEMPRRRGRPRQYDPEQALAKATESFWQDGYAGTSLDDLVAATGMNRPSLYAAFGDKRDLYLRALEQYRRQSRAIGVDIIVDDPPLRVFLRRYYSAAIDLYLAGDKARGCFSISTAPAAASSDPAVRQFLAESIRGADRYVADRLERGRTRGELAANVDPAALAPIVTGTMHTLAVRARAGASRTQLMALAAAATDLICGPPR